MIHCLGCLFYKKCMSSDITLSQYDCWNFIDDELAFGGLEEVYRHNWFDEYIDGYEDMWVAEYQDMGYEDYDWYGLELNWDYERWLEEDPGDNDTLHFIELD